MEPSDPAWIKCFHMYFFVWFLLLFFTFLGMTFVTLTRARLECFTRVYLEGWCLTSCPGCDFDTLVTQKKTLIRLSRHPLLPGLLLKSPRGWRWRISTRTDGTLISQRLSSGWAMSQTHTVHTEGSGRNVPQAVGSPVREALPCFCGF